MQDVRSSFGNGGVIAPPAVCVHTGGVWEQGARCRYSENYGAYIALVGDIWSAVREEGLSIGGIRKLCVAGVGESGGRESDGVVSEVVGGAVSASGGESEGEASRDLGVGAGVRGVQTFGFSGVSVEFEVKPSGEYAESVSGNSDECTDLPVRPPGVGKNWERNCVWRQEKKLKKQRRAARCGAELSGGGALRESLEKRWQAENELAKLKAEQQLVLLQARDMEAVKKMQRTQIMRTTEVCKTQVERAFSKLKKTGNVPADGTGSAETVVSSEGVPSLSRSDGSGISPDSSVSQQEIRQMQKDLLDLAEKEKKQAEALEYLRYSAPDQYENAMFKANCKQAYTLDSRGEPEIDTVGSIHSDGKFYPSCLHAGYLPNPAHRNARNEVPFPGEEDLW